MKYAILNSVGQLSKIGAYTPITFDKVEDLKKAVKNCYQWKQNKELFKKCYKIVEVNFVDTEFTFED